MSRSRNRATENQVSLFPFLAVLICTMGVLIVLLVLVVKRADHSAQQAQTEIAEDVEARAQHLRSELELIEFKNSELSEFRPELLEQLRQQQRRRSHLEDHTRQLKEELTRLQEQWTQLHSQQETSPLGDAAQFAELEEQLAELKRWRDEERERVQNQQKQFAVVAYDGRSGTRRRPIYIECTSDGIEIQPYGIQLHPDDFTQPVLAGNPLDAAILAIREYWQRIDPSQSAGMPYPLILVRPGGSESYALVREAMKSWDSEFGHQIVPGDMALTFPKADPSLTSQLATVIADAKRRQTALASAVHRFNRAVGGDGVGMRPEGGFGDSTQPPASPESPGLGGTSAAQHHDALSHFEQAPSDSGNSPVLRATHRRGGFSQPSDSANRFSLTDRSGDDTWGEGTSGEGSFESDEVSQGGTSFPATTVAQHGGDSAGEAQGQSAQEGQQAGGNGGSPSRPSSMTAGTASSGAQSAGSPSAASPLSESRGQGWALPTRTAGGTGFRRPIPITVYPDRLVVHAGSNPRLRDQTFRFEPDMTHGIDAMMDAIWQQIESWGVAGFNAYWKPELRVRIAPQADPAFRELAQLLEGSGLDVSEVR